MFSPFNLITAAVALVLLLGGYFTGRDHGKTACELERKTERARLIEDWAGQVLDEIERGDRIDRAAAQRNATLDQKLQETKHALQRATVDRPCLGGAALRLLDQSTGLRAHAGLEVAGALHGGSAAAAANPEDAGTEDIATDTGVAQWIVTAGDYYERCRARIRDIRQYEAGK